MCLTGEVLRLGRISGHTVNGGWSSWSSWSQCSRDCSRGIRSRKRTCSNPEPKYGGQTCLGPAQEYQECNITPCPGKTCTHMVILQYEPIFDLAMAHNVQKHHWPNKERKHREKTVYCSQFLRQLFLTHTQINTYYSTAFSSYVFPWLMDNKMTYQIIRNHKRNQLQIRGVTKTPIYSRNPRDNPCGAPVCNYIAG